MEPPLESPYSRLAEIYDHVMRHVDYGHWADFLESVTVRHQLLGSRVIDLACGTGSLSLELASRGYRVTGADGCPEMLAVATSKAREAELSVPFLHRNLLDLSNTGLFEWAVCLYDSVNYLMSVEDIDRMLAQVHGIVEPGGIFIFDVCTETNSVRYFRDLKETDQGNGFSYTRHSYYESGVQYNAFEIRFTRSGEVFHERHAQRIYPLSEMEAAVERSRFRLEAAYDGFGFEAPSERSDRVHFVARA